MRLPFRFIPQVRRTEAIRAGAAPTPSLGNDQMSPLFQAVTEASEEAVVNSLFAARSVTGFQGTIPQLPVDRVEKIIRAMPKP